MIHRTFVAVALVLSMSTAAFAQRVVVRGRHGTRVTTVVGPAGGTRVVINPVGPGNRTVVRTGPRGNTVINTPGPGRVVIRR